MREQILILIQSALKDCNQCFIREEDIQLYLANCFIQSQNFDNVFIEYHIPKLLLNEYPWSDIDNLYVDIVLEKDGKFYPIEIKYKTTKQVLPIKVFGQDVSVILGQHGAQNIGCYDFWKDVKRIEMFEETFEKVEKGVVLFVSNDKSYKKAPLSSSVGYSQFSIHNNRNIESGTILQWNKNLSISNGRPSIPLRSDYTLIWNDMLNSENSFLIV